MGWITVRRVALVLLVAAAVAALLVPTLRRSPRPCTHGESSMAVSIDAGGVHVIQAPHATGCTP